MSESSTIEESPIVKPSGTNKNRDVFATNLGEIGHTKLIKHEIKTGDAPPVKCRPYRTTPQMKAEIDRQLDETSLFLLRNSESFCFSREFKADSVKSNLIGVLVLVLF
jgi:hypothetical protein